MAVLLILALFLLPAPGCAGRPVPGLISQSFAPGSGFGGHWGIDFDVVAGTSVASVLGGTVTFAGRVVDNLSVTVSHGGGVRTSYSFLNAATVVTGDVVTQGELVGTTGRAHGREALHFSLRHGDRYLDPESLLSCARAPGPALRLISETRPAALYAVRRAARNSGRNLRSTSCSASNGRRSRPPFARPRRHLLHHRR